jgi:four helix bundle protein
MRDHKKLKAFALADKVALMTYKVTRSFPQEEIYGLTSQMRRAAVSVPSNIVEGCARSSEQEYRRFLDIAFGSLRELAYQFSLASRLGYVASSSATDMQEALSEAERVLSALVRSFRCTGSTLQPHSLTASQPHSLTASQSSPLPA